jgi:hypothetical protein
MKNVLKYLRLIKLFWRHFPVLLFPDDYWTSADAKSWSNWLGTDAGAKFRNLRFNMVYESQLKAITERSDSAYAAGVAFGMRAMIAFEDSLLQISLDQGVSDRIATETTEGQFSSVNR